MRINKDCIAVYTSVNFEAFQARSLFHAIFLLPTVLQGKAINEAVKPLQWLIGKWKSTDGKGVFPNIAPFTYGEQIEFFSLGQPLLNYCSYSWHPERGAAMHLESGFLRIKPGTNQVAFMVAHNFGKFPSFSYPVP